MPRKLAALICLALLLASCTGPAPTAAPSPAVPDTPAPTLTAEPTPTPEPRKLTVCLAEEPQTLYAYGGNSRSMWSVLEALYDGPFDTRGFAVQPVILEKLPSLAGGDAVIQTVSVRGGAPVVDLSGAAVALKIGTQVLPSGCGGPECAVTWDGSAPVQMDQLSLTFRVKPEVTWSDGTPVSAADSVFSFNLAADPVTPASKWVVDRTASYTALDERTVQWLGVPGFVEERYPTFFFLPLPKHALGGLSAGQLLEDEAARTRPLGWGPYVLEGWAPGESIRLVKNPNYFRAAEGLPKFDVLEFRFNGSPADSALMALVAGQCDVVEPNPGFLPLLEELINTQNNGRLQLLLGVGPEWEQISLGIRPASYDDGHDPALERPDFFGDARTRQALALCIDRAGIVETFFHNRTEVPRGYLPPSHPLYQAGALPDYPFDPQQGAALLDEAGWKDADGDPATPRTAFGVVGVRDSTPLQLELLTTQAALRTETARLIAASLTGCGVGMTTRLASPGEVFAPGPDGLLFGRRFDLAIFTWEAGQGSTCRLYTGAQAPTAANHWIGTNVTGYADPAFDAACAAASWALPDQPDYAARVQAAEKLFAEQLPAVPLYFQLKMAIARPDMCGLDLDVTARSVLWNLEALDYGETCP